MSEVAENVAEQEESVATKVAKGAGSSITVKKKTASKKATKPKIADKIMATSSEVESLTKNKAYKLVHTLAEDADFTYFKLGGVLSVIQANNWFADDGYDNFRAFVETEFGLGYRKAMYWVAIYNGLVKAGVEWDRVKILGWTKLKELADIITDENAEEWVEIAKDMTVIQLQEHIREVKKGTLEASEVKTEGKKLTTLTFKVYDEQKEIIKEAIDKAKSEAETEYDSVAIEAICMNYASGGSTVGTVTDLNSVMKKHTWEEVLGEFEKIFPDVHLTVEV